MDKNNLSVERVMKHPMFPAFVRFAEGIFVNHTAATYPFWRLHWLCFLNGCRAGYEAAKKEMKECD